MRRPRRARLPRREAELGPCEDGLVEVPQPDSGQCAGHAVERRVEGPSPCGGEGEAEFECQPGLVAEPQENAGQCAGQPLGTQSDGVCRVVIPPSDGDGDGVPDGRDNCSELVNPSQLDTNADGYGNAWDFDYDQDGRVGASDSSRLRTAFGARTGSTRYDPDLDAEGDGAIGLPEFNRLRAAFGEAPGSSGLACAGTVPCP